MSTIVTWVCVHCHRGWTQPAGPTSACTACGRRAQQRGTYLVVALDHHHVDIAGVDELQAIA